MCWNLNGKNQHVQLPNPPKSQRSGQLPVPPGPSWASFCSCRLGVEPAVGALLGRKGGAPAPRLNGVRRCVPVALQPFTQGKIT